MTVIRWTSASQPVAKFFTFFLLCLLATPFLTFAQSSSAPRVEITRSGSGPVDSLFYITVTFSEAVTGFTLTDLKVIGGIVGSFHQRNETTYTATITPALNFKGDLKINVPGNVVKNAANRGNRPSPTLRANIPDPIIDIDVTLHNRGKYIETFYIYKSGRGKFTAEGTGYKGHRAFESACDHVEENVPVFYSFVRYSHISQPRTTCKPTDLLYPGVPSLSEEESRRRLQGATTFTARYMDHGNIVNTEIDDVPSGTRTHLTVNTYSSGQVEEIKIEDFREYQKGFDYNADGDFQDRVKIRSVTIDQNLSSEHVQILSDDGTVLRDFGERVTNAPRRIHMPAGIPDFLRFNGAIDDVKIHVAATGVAGEYHVKIERLDASVQFLVEKRTYDTQIQREELRPDHFERVPLITPGSTTTYVIYAVKGDLYHRPFEEHPNFYVRYDAQNWLNPVLVKAGLDKARNILRRANIGPFLRNFNNTRIHINPYVQGGSSYQGNTITLGGVHAYSSRPLIHEAAHSYHANQLSDGFENSTVKALYENLPSKDTSVRYGDEENSYWRRNVSEFFAETLTTYIYLKANELPNLAITQVDSTFYTTVMQPYFDDLFSGSSGSGDSIAEAIELNPQGYTTGSISRRIDGQLESLTDVDHFRIEIPRAGILTASTAGADTTIGLYQLEIRGNPARISDEETADGSERESDLGVAVEPGTYYLLVSAGSTVGDYRLSVDYSPVSVDNPSANSFQSGIGVLSGWACDVGTVEVVFDSQGRELGPIEAGYGTERGDTASVCGPDTTDTGFGLLFNWNLLGDGNHAARILIDGVEFARREFTVTTLGGEFREDLQVRTEVADFPQAGETTILEWEQSLQNFVIAGEERARGGVQLMPEVARLDVPAAGSFQSGISIISGWVCEAEVVEIVFESHATGESLGPVEASYGTERGDTIDACGDADNAFGVLFNWNLLGSGVHTVRALADGEEFASSVVTVNMPSTEEYLEGVQRVHAIADFPAPGQTTTVEWQAGRQNFVITGVETEE